ncbi:hypothetical protein GCM10023215_39760 [Pseudonocardia yuanmonensis]|uniref:DUF2267 domain-containing protein n=1 Tax=Pseudonocardia yuanmonensis TaxID=1095914 RepID=A0ABP8WY89_9PSEU
MHYEEFIGTASARTGRAPEIAESLTHATLRVLAERLRGGETRDLASQLPKELQPDLIPPTQQAQRHEAQDFVRRVAEQAQVDEGEARKAVAAVLTTTREDITAGESEDIASQMARGLDVLMTGAQ